jgi:ribosome recycling factor
MTNRPQVTALGEAPAERPRENSRTQLRRFLQRYPLLVMISALFLFAMIVVAAFDKEALNDIEKAILASDIGLTPANDGKVIRISVPPLTEERRKDLVKQVKKKAEEHKVGVREARRDAIAMLKELESDGSLPKDDRHRADKHVQDLTNEFTGAIDSLTAEKEQEVLEV